MKKMRRKAIGCAGVLLLLCVCAVPISLLSPSKETESNREITATFIPVSTETPTISPSTKVTEASEATSVPTIPPSVTPKPVPTATPTEVSMIVNANKVIGSSASRVAQMLGKPTDTQAFGAGEIAEVPNGGEMRTYQVGKYTIWVAFDKRGIAKGLQVVEGLKEDGYSLNQWPMVLKRMGLGYVGRPDITAPAAVRWTNAGGYTIMIVANKIGGVIWTIKVYQLP